MSPLWAASTPSCVTPTWPNHRAASEELEGFDKVEDGLAGFAAGFEAAPIDQFLFERAPEGFHGGVVITAGFATHGRERLALSQGVRVLSVPDDGPDRSEVPFRRNAVQMPDYWPKLKPRHLYELSFSPETLSCAVGFE